MKVLDIITHFAASPIASDVNINVSKVSAEAVVAGVLNIFYFAAGVTAVIAIIIAGFHYVSSNGDSALIAKAKNTIMYAVAGIAVIILAFAITNFVIGRM